MAESGWDASGSYGGGYLRTIRHPRGGEYVQSFALLDARAVAPAFDHLLAQFRSPAKDRLDVRGQAWVMDLAWATPALSLFDGGLNPAYTPVYTHLQDTFRSRPQPKLNVRGQDWVMNMAWLHDPLSLTDTPLVIPTTTSSRQRRMASIIKARRRRGA